MKVNVTVKLTTHPNPQRLIDMWSNLVLKELLRQEQGSKEAAPLGFGDMDKEGMNLNDNSAGVSQAMV